MQNATRNFFTIIAIMLMVGCAAPKPSDKLIVAPQLSHYSRFEIFPESSNATEQRATGTLDFNAYSASLELHIKDSQAIEHLFVQPETCRDDPSPDCKRRFAISGRITALGVPMNCYIPIRNDTSIGYYGQTLTGLCRDRNGRSFAISIFSN